MSRMLGQLVTETLDFDDGRQVTVYVPPSPPEVVVFAGDGQLIAPWGGFLEASDLPPTMIIGAHRLDDETLRLQEYSAGMSTVAFAFDPERFTAHERFFVEDVRGWARTRFGVDLPSDRTAVFGVSASGELALAMGLRHSDIYGTVFCASPGGGYRPPAVMPCPLPRVYLVAGRQEPFFLENATRWADAVHDAGADVVMTERIGSHGDAFWRDEFPLMVAWAFGRQGVVARPEPFEDDRSSPTPRSSWSTPRRGSRRAESACGECSSTQVRKSLLPPLAPAVAPGAARVPASGSPPGSRGAPQHRADEGRGR